MLHSTTHLNAAGEHILCAPDGLAERLVFLSRSEMERLSPAVLVEVGDEIVETDRRGMPASAVWGVKVGVS